MSKKHNKVYTRECNIRKKVNNMYMEDDITEAVTPLRQYDDISDEWLDNVPLEDIDDMWFEYDDDEYYTS